MSSQELPHSVLYDGAVALTSHTFLAGISWGIMSSFYVICMFSLARSSAKYTRKTIAMAVWITILWILSTLTTVAFATRLLYAYSWQMNYPGGPTAYIAAMWNQPVPIMTVATYLLAMWFADAMMLWRLHVFCHGSCRITRVVILSVALLLYIGTIGAGGAILATIHSNQTLWSAQALEVAIPCFGLSLLLNVFVTAFISIRLLLFKRVMEKTIGRKDARASPYTTVAAMLIESAALYAAWSLVFIVVNILRNPGQYVMIVTLCHVQVISPTMIVYRVSQGLGYEHSTSARSAAATRLAFAGDDSTQVTEDGKEQHCIAGV